MKGKPKQVEKKQNSPWQRRWYEMKQGAHLERFPATFCVARSPSTLRSHAPTAHTFTPEKLKLFLAHAEDQQPPPPSPPLLTAAGLTSCSAMRIVFSWIVSPSARALLGDWIRLTSLCSHSSRRRRIFLSSERYVLATVSSLSSASHRQTKTGAQTTPASICPRWDLLEVPEPSAASC